MNDRCVREGTWHGWWEPSEQCAVEVRGTTICIVGYAHIGKYLASLCNGFRGRLLAMRRSPGEHRDEATGALVAGTDRLQPCLTASDFVVLTLPLTDENQRADRREDPVVVKPTVYSFVAGVYFVMTVIFGRLIALRERRTAGR